MKSLGEVSKVLAERAAKRRYGKMQLAADAGVTYRTLSHVLSGEQDFKVSTLMAVADRLGLELVLVPKEARAMFSSANLHTARVPDTPAPRLIIKGLKASLADSGKDHSPGIVSKVQARLARARTR